jgi:hypothetical protein
MPLRLRRAPEDRHLAILEERKATANDRRFHGARDAIVAQQHIVSGLAIVEREETIFAIW